MERLTEHCPSYEGIKIKGCSTIYHNKERKGAPASNAIVRLAAYEDTGLSPEEIKALVEPSNDPLTLDELREMEGLPVYVKWNATEGFYCIISSTGEKGLYYTEQNGHIEYAPFALYGDTWRAYRRRKEP